MSEIGSNAFKESLVKMTIEFPLILYSLELKHYIKAKGYDNITCE